MKNNQRTELIECFERNRKSKARILRVTKAGRFIRKSGILVIPGITCFRQMSGRNGISFNRQVRPGLEYLKSPGFFKDEFILLNTEPAVLKGKGAY